MWYTQHMIINIVPSIIWFYLTGNWLFSILFFVTAFAVDSDHFLVEMWIEKEYNIGKIFNKFKNTYHNPAFQSGKFEECVLHPFHTVELIILLGIVSYYYNIFIPIYFGVAFHMLSDIVTIAWGKDKRIFFATLFLLDYLKRR